ncbi:hypothetical protein HYV49_06035 [Candidatus Pacearchaeota archaeon]|nr:hypothetical protein [Candidatus Pacearchaeota archaeon]
MKNQHSKEDPKLDRRVFLKSGLAGILGIGMSGCMITTTPTTVLDAVGGAFGFLSQNSFKIGTVGLNDENNDGKYDNSEIIFKNIFSPDEEIGILAQNSSLSVVDVSAVVKDKEGNIIYANEGRLNKRDSVLFQGINTQGTGYETYSAEIKINGAYDRNFHAEKNLQFVVNHNQSR